MLIVPHRPNGSPSQPKPLKFTLGFVSAFEQNKQNSSDPLFSIASTEKEKQMSYIRCTLPYCFNPLMAIFYDIDVFSEIQNYFVFLFQTRTYQLSS